MKKYILFAVGVFIIIFTYFILSDREDLYSVSDPYTYNAVIDREFWVAQVKKSGSEKSYRKFVITNNESAVEVQHVRAHVIGEVLFDAEGVRGVGICDSNFGFGCFHGLFTVGFSSMGKTFVQEADSLCVERYGIFGTGCQHGIGHGIVEYVGHANLNEALLLCEETSQPTPLLGCTSGVFMEHNTPFTVLSGIETLKPYPFSEKTPYGVCEDVLEKFKESCYYELAGWWEVVLEGDKQKMGALCSRVTNHRLRTTCALGFGNILGFINKYSIEESSEACFKMPKNIITSCHAGAAWSMLSNPEYSDRSMLVCDMLDAEENKKCKDSYDLAKN